MNLRKLGVIASVFIGSSVVVFPLVATAKPLTLVNATKDSFTVRVNYYCSGEFGTMKPNSSKVVGEEQLDKLCGQTSSNCEAKIFRSNDCTGNQIGSFKFDTKTGLKDNFQSAQNYSMTVSYQLNMASLTEALKNSTK